MYNNKKKSTFDIHLTEAVSLLSLTLSQRQTGRGACDNVPTDKN
jgi:hypothetical protein